MPDEPLSIHFEDVAADWGLRYRWPDQPRPMRSPEAFGCGCALLDYDHDGRQDVLLVADPHVLLFRNVSQRQFTDVTAAAGLTTAEADWTGCAVGDFDSDGFLDILLTGFHRLALYRNRGDGSFVEVTMEAGLDSTNGGHWGSSAGPMDLDGDGDLDFVILNYVIFGPDERQYCELGPGVLSGCPPSTYRPEFGEIWSNDGAGGFQLVAPSAGMEHTHGKSLVLAFTDLDDDCRMDFYVGNDGTYADLLHNQGNMQFANIGYSSGVAMNYFKIMAAMGADWADFDRDGLLDLTVTGFSDEAYAVFRNTGSQLFAAVANQTGLSAPTYKPLGFGAKWLDMDNDGWPDLSFANGHVYHNSQEISAVPYRQPLMLFHNRQGKQFVDLVPRLGAAISRPMVGRGSATGDLDDDGRIDLLVVDYEGEPMLLHNRSQTSNHWLKFDLRSPGPNRFAYGARVTGLKGKQVWVAEVSPASSYLSSSDPRIHWGLGEADTLDEVVIRWPSGQQETLRDVTADRTLLVLEGAGIVRETLPPSPGTDFAR